MKDSMIVEQSHEELEKIRRDLAEVFAEDTWGGIPFGYIHRKSPTLSRYFEPGDCGGSLHKILDDDGNNINVNVPWIKRHVKESQLPVVQAAIKAGVAKLLFFSFHPSFIRKIQKMSKELHDSRFYDSAITAAATLLYSRYPLDLIYRLVGSRDLKSQMSELWHQFSEWGKQGLPDYEVYKLIVKHKIDKDKYPFLTECDIITMLKHYNEQCCEDRFLRPYPYECPFLEEDDEEDIDTILRDIKGVVDKMECFQIDKVDDYTHLLIKIFRGDRLTEELTLNKYEPLFAEVEGRIVDTSCFGEPRWLDLLSKEGLTLEKINFFLKWSLDKLVGTVISLLEDHLLKVQRPLIQVCNSRSLKLSNQVCEIIQVAELRRIALGSRFISQKHLMWAFSECGYVLPRNTTMVFDLCCDDEDHPPYHIYEACVKLAEYFREEVIEIQHFVFATLKRVIEVPEEFMDFVTALDNIRNRKKALSERLETHEEETRRCEETKKRRIEATNVEYETW